MMFVTSSRMFWFCGKKQKIKFGFKYGSREFLGCVNINLPDLKMDLERSNTSNITETKLQVIKIIFKI